jgi:AraC-like DNA-binding protein
MSEVHTAPAAPVIRASGSTFQRQMNGLLNTRFQLTATGRCGYDGEIMQSFVTERLRLADIRFTPHSTRLLPGKPATRAVRNYLVSWQIEGASVVRQFGREAEVGPGQLFFLNASEPFEIETRDIWTRSVYLDSQFWQEVFPERDQYTATALDCRTGMGSICTQVIEQLFPAVQTLSIDSSMRMAGSLTHLLAVAMISELPAQPGRSPRESMFVDRIKAFARANLPDPELDCERVAAAINLSVRHVHQLFTAEGITLMRWIWAERLKRVARELCNPDLSYKPVSAIAFEWGFSEAAHFSRSFKQRYGMSPAEFRRKGLAGLDRQQSVQLN